MEKLSDASRKRLLLLAEILSDIKEKTVTSKKLAELSLQKETSIRKDISFLEGISAGKKNGYSVEELKNIIEKELNISRKTGIHNCCIVGLDSLGQAFMERDNFNGTPFNLAAGFDTNQNRLDLIKSKIPLFPTLDLEKIIRRLNIEFAILTVQNEKALPMAERLEKYGIKGIINCTDEILHLSKKTYVYNASIPSMLKFMLSEVR